MKKREFVDEICKILENNNVISHQESVDLKKNFEGRSQITFDDFLIEEGLVEKEDLLKALSIYYRVPSFDPIGYFFDHYLLVKFPKDFLLRNLILPLEVVEDNILVVVANNPNDEELLPALGKFVSYDIQFMVAIAQDIVETIEDFYDKSLTDLELDDNLVPQKEEELQKEVQDIEELPKEK